MHPDQLHRRRMQFNDVIRQVAVNLPIPVPRHPGEMFPLSVAMSAWKDFLRGKFFPSRSPEEVIRDANWNEILLRIQSWAAGHQVILNTSNTTTKATAP